MWPVAHPTECNAGNGRIYSEEVSLKHSQLESTPLPLPHPQHLVHFFLLMSVWFTTSSTKYSHWIHWIHGHIQQIAILDLNFFFTVLHSMSTFDFQIYGRGISRH